MRILDARIDWFHGWANAPELQVLVDHYPDTSDLKFVKCGDLYYAQGEDVAHFYAWDGKPGQGFGGRQFRLNMEDGTQTVLKGPFSSNAGFVNFMGFGPVVEVGLVEEEDRGYWESGEVSYAVNLLLETVEVAMARYLPQCHLERCVGQRSIDYVPALLWETWQDSKNLVKGTRREHNSRILKHCGN
jgi:hypothetical protein